jgi:hypothetical protein
LINTETWLDKPTIRWEPDEGHYMLTVCGGPFHFTLRKTVQQDGYADRGLDAWFGPWGLHFSTYRYPKPLIGNRERTKKTSGITMIWDKFDG